MMKIILPVYLILLVICSACSSSKEDLEPALNYDQQENLFLKDFRKEAIGHWRVDKMEIAKGYLLSPPQKDSIILNVGYIDVNNIEQDAHKQEKFNQLQASFTIDNQSIPIKARLMGYKRDEKQFIGAVGLIESAYVFSGTVYVNELPLAYQFLNDYFFGDNYVIELDENAEHMTWKGLNRYVRVMELTKVK